MPLKKITAQTPKGNLLFIAFGGAIFIESVWLLLQMCLSGKIIFGASLFTLAIPLTGLTAASLAILTGIYRKQYVIADKNKSLLIDNQNRTLEITCNGHIYLINNADIRDAELHRPRFLRSLLPGYLKINLLNNTFFLITEFLATEYDLQALLKGKQRNTQKRFLCFIKKDDLRHCVC